MVIEIEGKEYELNFGWRFLKYVSDAKGLSFNLKGADVNTGLQGLNFVLMGLQQEDEQYLKLALRGGLATERRQPTDKQIEQFIDDKAEIFNEEEDALGDFYKEVYESIKKQPTVARKLKKQALQREREESLAE